MGYDIRLVEGSMEKWEVYDQDNGNTVKTFDGITAHEDALNYIKQLENEGAADAE